MTADNLSPFVPKLRFPEFRDDPTWSAPQFADLYGFKRTNTLSRDKLNYETGTIRNIHYGDIHTKFKPLFRVGDEHVPYVIPDASANGFDDYAFCEEGDIVLADASEDLDDVGKAIEVVSLDGERVVAGTHTILATRRGSVPVVGFGGQLFQSAAVRAGIKKEAQGAKVYGISAKRISVVLVPVPPTVAEQQKIADCLGSLDDLIAAEGRKLEALRQHKQGLMQKLFPRPGESVPRLRFPEFEDAPEWESRELGLVTSKIGSGVTPRGGEKNYRSSGRPFVRSQNVGWGEFILDNVVHIDEDTHASFAATEVEEGDVLLNISGASIGRSAVADARIAGGNVNQHVCIIRCLSEQIQAWFLSQYLISKHGQDQIDSCQAGGNRQGLNFGQIRSFLIPQPKDVAEQERIADCLRAADIIVATQAQRISALKRQKQGALQQLFPSLVEG